MTSTPTSSIGNGSEPPAHSLPQESLSSQLPPVDEICRILARVLTRVQGEPQQDATAQGDAS
jgi:hypothetical protein